MISLLARVFIFLIDRVTQEVPMKNIWKKLSIQFLRYAIELLGSMSTDEAWRHLPTLHFYPEYIDLPGVYAYQSLQWFITSPPEGVARYCFHPVCLCVCLSVCLSVCLCVYLHRSNVNVTVTVHCSLKVHPTHILYQCAKFGEDRMPFNVIYDLCDCKYQNIGRTHTHTHRHTHRQTDTQTDRVKTIPRNPLRGAR